MKKLTRYNVNAGLADNTIRLYSKPDEDGVWVPSIQVAELEVELDKVQARLDLQRQTDTAAMQFLKEVYEDRNVWGYERHNDWLERVGRYITRYSESLPEDRTPLTMLQNAEKELEAARLEISKLRHSEALLQNQLMAAQSDIAEFRKKNNKLSTSLDETMTSLGKAYQEVEKWKEEYRVTEEARASFEKTAVANQRENVQLKLNQSQAIYGEQIKSGEYLSKQDHEFKVKMLQALGRSTLMTADELSKIDVFEEVAKAHKLLEHTKEVLEWECRVDLIAKIKLNEYFATRACDPENACATHGRCWPHSSTEEYHQLEKVWKTLEGIPGIFLTAWSVCRLQNVEEFAKAVLAYRKAKESQ